MPESPADSKHSSARKSSKKSKSSKPLRKKARRSSESSESSSGGSTSGSSSSRSSSGSSNSESSSSSDDERAKSDRRKKQHQSAEVAKSGSSSSSKRSNKRRSTTGSSGSGRNNVAAKVEESDGGGDEEEEEVYCVCQKPYHHEFMFMCDRCQAWFHPKCVGLTKAQIKANPDGLYYCAQCRAIVRAQQATAADSSGRKQGLSTREQLVAAFAQLLSAASTAPAESGSKASDSETKAQRLAGELEAALFECSGRSATTNLYVSRARFLLYNLNETKNATLAKRLLSGELSAAVVAQTNPRVLASRSPVVLLPAVAAASVAPPQQPRISVPRKA